MSMRLLFAGLAAGVMFLSALPAHAAAPASDPPGSMVHRVYPVADLIVPLVGTAAQVSKDAPGKTLEDNLIHLIESAVCPRSWGCMGGEGSIDYYQLGMALVVRQTPAVHDDIDHLLSALRRLQDVEVTVELRFLTVSDECLEKLGVGKVAESETRLLDDAQAQLLVETVQRDSRSTIMQAPKLTVFNGQKAMLDLSEQRCFVGGVEFVPAAGRQIVRPQTKIVNTGVQVSVLPVVAPDNRTVSLQVGVFLLRGDAPKPVAAPIVWAISPDSGKPILLNQQPQTPRSAARTFKTTVKMTDGGTALLSGWTQHREMRTQIAAPVLSKVPYINQLFGSVSYSKECEHLLVMVTPHVAVRREQEDHVPEKSNPPADAAGFETSPEPAATQPRSESHTVGEALHEAPWNAANNIYPVAAVEAIPPAAQAMPVHRRSFRLDYALENVGPTGVSKIAVWITRDTRAWNLHPQHVSAKGYATITVPEDGRWGFTVIPYNGAGLSAAPPKSGEQPQVWVEVDTQPPEVEILSASALVVRGEEMLRVHYRSEDAHLKNKPVTISYATAREGPWTVRATDLSSAGMFFLSLKGLPHEFYVRVEAEDQAGNIGQAAEWIKADLKIPRIRDVKVKTEE